MAMDWNDATRWTLTVLPLPKRMAFVRVLGWCGGQLVGEAEARGGASGPFWWPQGQPTALTHPTQKRLAVRMATGDGMPGSWSRSGGGFGGALGWQLRDGELQLLELHPGKSWEYTYAMGSGGGGFAGSGQRKVKKGERAVDVALFWRADGAMLELPPAEPDGSAMAMATDGRWVVGQVGRNQGKRAALWAVDGGPPVVLGDERSITEASAVADGEQVGVRWAGRSNRAVLWRGSAESLVDLTPEGHQSGWARGCAGGFQVGHVQVRDTTASGAGSMAAKAALWRGDAASFVDLQRCVPAPWNASTAVAVERRNGKLRVAGELTQFGVTDELTARESQYLIASRPAVWEIPID